MPGPTNPDDQHPDTEVRGYLEAAFLPALLLPLLDHGNRRGRDDPTRIDPAGIGRNAMAMLMIDTIHQSAGNIPEGTPKVAGYVTGTPEIRWTPADWGRFPHAGHITIDQGHGTDIRAADVLDTEQGAATPVEAARWAHARHAAGIGFSDIYISQGRIPDLIAQLHDLGPADWFMGHVRLWVANWNLTQAEATAVLGVELFGLKVVAVQWASPSSNPALQVPGSRMTLRQANLDLSVTLDYWHAAPGTQPPQPTPPPHPVLHGMLVTEHDTDLVGRAVTSHDGGKTWTT